MKAFDHGPRKSARDRVLLGNTGIEVSRLALGSGTDGVGMQSRQTRMGRQSFVSLILHGYERGITFWDAADQYGSHPFFKEALNHIPREKVVILTKSVSKRDPAGMRRDLDRFRTELDTDYIDMVLLHGLKEARWDLKFHKTMEVLSKAKAEGLIRAQGISCHSLAALQRAVDCPWTDVVMVRINHAGSHMDSSPAQMVPILGRAHRAGKGVIGMKILGCGLLSSQIEPALRFILNLDCIDAFSIGFENKAELDDLLTRLGVPD
ncbi:MAG: aldo/keto reductase [Desulfobacteraceae bacterium]